VKEYQKILYSELERRKTKNENYSLRAFARDIGISSSRLSEIFNDKQGLSKAKAVQIAKKLKFNRQKELWFSNLVEAEHSRSFMLREKAGESVKTHKKIVETHENIPLEKIDEYANWYYFAIRRLTGSKSFNPDPIWISEKLNIPKNIAKTALENLLLLGILVRDEAGHIKTQGNFNLLNQSNLKNLKEEDLNKIKEAFINIYNQLHQKVMEALRKYPAEKRDASMHFFSLNQKQIEKVKEFIRVMEDKVDAETYETEDTSETLYCLTTQLFPISEEL
jgi:uncharacterized protein (TIGR02147 family)